MNNTIIDGKEIEKVIIGENCTEVIMHEENGAQEGFIVFNEKPKPKPLHPVSEVFIVRGKLFGICADCGGTVGIDGPIFGNLHPCKNKR